MKDTAQRTPFGFLTLIALNKKPMYEGTVPHSVKAARRKKNKAARRARKVNR